MSAQQRRKRAPEAPPSPSAVAGPPRLLERFRGEVSPTLVREFGYRNPMQVPHLVKIVLNMGLGEALQNPKAIENAQRDLATISGQHPVVTRAKRSIAGFKVRRGMPIGTMTTLRGRRMWDFLDRLINATLPRMRDFRGVPTESLDGGGNYSLGMREQILFPEIDYDTIDKARGLGVTIVTTARSREETLRLLQLLGMPFAGGQSRG